MRIAVLGAGYAGLTLARRLERACTEAELVVVDESDHHLVAHELHRVVRFPDLADAIQVSLPEVLENAEIRRARVEAVDASAGEATITPVAEEDGGTAGGTAETERLSYDYAAVCLGAETAFYDMPGVEDHAIPLKRIADAERIRESFHGAAGGRTVIGGAGLSGVQVAGELAAVAGEEGYDADVVLLEQMDSVAPSFSPSFRGALREELDERGVIVRTGTTVAGADDGAVELSDGERLDYDTFVWTGGIGGPRALDGERPVVRADLRPARRVGVGTFVVGDAGRVVDADGERVPASAQAAVREARVAARNIERLVRESDGGDGFDPRLDRYAFDPTGWAVSVGDGAVVQLGPTVLRGAPARAAKAAIGAGYLSSVGGVRDALALVREELGWPGPEAAPDGIRRP
jgi:NADH dehydrogenase